MIKQALLVVFLALLFHVFYPSVFPNSSGLSFVDRVQITSPDPLDRLCKLIGPVIRWVVHHVAALFYRPQEGVLFLKGIKDEVEILTDHFGVPHIYANNEEDLYFAQGYVHAHERLWHMEFNRYLVSGCLSQLFGKIAINTDILIRSFGISRKRSLEPFLDPQTKKMFESYVSGVNAYLNRPEIQLPAEFYIFDISPTNWTVGDLISYAYFMVWQMTEGWEHEIARSAIFEKVGDLFHELEVEYPPISTPSILLHPHEYGIINSDRQREPSLSPFAKKVKGSNTWVINGSLTETGNVILCNDPHLPLHAPSFWFEVHLEVPSESIKITGVSVPGLPGIIIGHNQHIAWGATLAFMDVEDLVLEKINPENPNQYEFRGEWQNMEIIEERFSIKYGKPVTVDMQYTRNGPLISDWISLSKPVSFRSTILNCSVDVLSVWLLLAKAQNWDHFSKAVHKICFPLSISYADTSGNIGFWATGSVPIRKPGMLGKLPIPGWTDEGDWIGIVPPQELPHSFNPEKGFIVAANNRIVEDDYPYYLGSCWVSGYRAARITQILSEKISRKELFSVDFLQKIQIDVKSLAVLSLIDALRPYSAEVAERLQGTSLVVWETLINHFDGYMTTNSSSASVITVGHYFLLWNILEPVLGENLTHVFLGVGPHPLLADSSELHGYEIISLVKILQNESSWWISNAGGAAHVISKSIHMTVSWLTQQLGTSPTAWEYGKLHSVTFTHVAGQVPVLGEVFNVGPFPIGGDLHTPMMTGFKFDKPYHLGGWATHWRYCVDMGNLEGAESINVPGQSGNIGSPHYDDMVPLWLKGDYHPMFWTKLSIEQNLERKLVLKKITE